MRCSPTVDLTGRSLVPVFQFTFSVHSLSLVLRCSNPASPTMQIPQDSPEFLNLLQRSGLLTADQIRRALTELNLPETTSAHECAAAFVAARFITPFQAERIIEGRYRGLTIGRWRVRELLGFGGMGCVYIADALDYPKKVALKVLAGKHAVDNGMLTRLRLEARAGIKLRHPGIIKTLQLESTGAVHFLVMDLVRGISLHELVALQGPQKPGVVCDLGVQIAEALQYAHHEGVIHRDIKPANFLIEPDGRIHVLDFGLAMLEDNVEDEFTLSMVFGHDCLGTPDYISPEQSKDSRSIDPRSDIYSLGATLFVALTGRVPFPEKSNRAKLEARRNRPPRKATDVIPDLPEEVSDILFKAMATNPEDRYASAADMAEALRPFAVREPVKFEFRKLITLRAKQAKAKLDKAERRSSAPRSSITSNPDWLRAVGSEAAFAAPSTPAAISWAGSATGSQLNEQAAGRSQVLREDEPTPIPASLAAKQTKADEEPKQSGQSAAKKPTIQGTDRPARKKAEQQPEAQPVVMTDWKLRCSQIAAPMLLETRSYTIGTSPGSDIRLEGQGIDTLHGTLIWADPWWEYRQESGKRPTWHDGKRIRKSIRLQHDAMLKIGPIVQINLRHKSPRSLRQREPINWKEVSRNVAFAAVILTMLSVTAAAAVALLRPDLLPVSIQEQLLRDSGRTFEP